MLLGIRAELLNPGIQAVSSNIESLGNISDRMAMLNDLFDRFNFEFIRIAYRSYTPLFSVSLSN